MSAIATVLEMIRKAEMTYKRQTDAAAETKEQLDYLYAQRDQITGQTDLAKKK